MTGDLEKRIRQPERPLGDEAIDRLVRLHSGRASAADHDSFARWRARSAAHEAAAREAEALWQDIAQTASAQAHRREEEESATAAAPPRRRGVTRRRVLGRRVVVGAMAASLAVAVAASGALGPVSGIIADHATRPGERRDIRLADGSRVILNTATALSVELTAAERRLTLHAGEALFDVASDPGRPFVVAAAGSEVRALGTAFSVGHDGAGIRVVVAEGVVELRPGSGAGARLRAGQQAAVDGAGRLRGPAPADAPAATAWTRGKLVFNKRPLAEVVAEIERYRSGRILVVNDSLKDLKVSGVFDLDDPEAALRTLEQTLKLTVVRLPLVTLIR